MVRRGGANGRATGRSRSHAAMQAKSRDDWIKRMIQVGTLLVPGSWWQGVGEEEKRRNYPCEIVNVATLCTKTKQV